MAICNYFCLTTYGWQWEPEGADMDAIEVEKYYRQVGGEFWIVEYFHQLVGTAAYHPTSRGENAVEIRKMYLLPAVRRQGLGHFYSKNWKARSVENSLYSQTVFLCLREAFSQKKYYFFTGSYNIALLPASRSSWSFGEYK